MYHINNKEEVRECRASIKKCPLHHFTTVVKAKEHLEEKNNINNKTFKKRKQIELIQYMGKDYLRIDTRHDFLRKSLQKAPLFNKKSLIKARKAKIGENISTILKNGLVETQQEIKEPGYVVTNPSGEEYFIGTEKFEKIYSLTDNNMYQSTQLIKAIKNPYKKNIAIKASWGEMQYGDNKAYFVQPEKSNEIYLIGHDEFHETYSMVEKDKPVTNPDNKLLSSSDFKKYTTIEYSPISKNIAVSSFSGSPKLIKNSYYGIPIDSQLLHQINEDVEKMVGTEKFEKMRQFKNERDKNEEYHITIIKPNELRKIKKENINIQNIINKEFSFKISGIGRLLDTATEKETWYVKLESNELDKQRALINLDKSYYHITLGFLNKDIHDTPRDNNTIIIKYC